MPKYETLRKTSRDNRLIRYALNHPELSVEEIGVKFEISKGRVSQILKKNGISRKKSK